MNLIHIRSLFVTVFLLKLSALSCFTVGLRVPRVVRVAVSVINMGLTYICSVHHTTPEVDPCGLFHVIHVFRSGTCRQIWIGPNRPDQWNMWVVVLPGLPGKTFIHWADWYYGEWSPY